MLKMRRSAAVAMLFVLGTAVLMTTTGCVTDARTSNQGGGSLLTAATKLLAHRIGDLTADEWQIVGDSAQVLVDQYNIDLQGYAIPTLTDEAAAAIVDFLDVNNIVTVEELVAAYESGAITLDDVPDELVGLIGG